MNRGPNWSSAFARQARADLTAFHALREGSGLPDCQALNFLQMACEKVAKAYLCGAGADPGAIQSSHAYIAKTLPVIAAEQAADYPRPRRRHRSADRALRQLAREIELLSPAVDDGGRRPDNCEYPWEDAAGVVLVPAERSFPNLDLLQGPAGRDLLKVLETAIHELA